MKTYGILAYPAKHSLSPMMFNAAFKAARIDAQYGVFEIPENEFASFMKQVRDEEIAGLSVSLPYKEVILAQMNEVDEDARKIGAANTVVNEGGLLKAYNTDFVGFNKAVGDVKGMSVVVMGAGGAARAIVYGLKKAGAAKITVLNRDDGKALKLAEEFGVAGAGLEKKMEFGGDLLVQASSIWTLHPDLNEEEVREFCPEEFVKKFSVVTDIVYKPRMTPLLKIAEGLGKKIVTGDMMLLYQAAEQFKLFTGKEAPVEVMERELIVP